MTKNAHKFTPTPHSFNLPSGGSADVNLAKNIDVMCVN